MTESDDQSQKPEDRFAGGIELDEGGLDNPADSLNLALELDDADKAIGAFRLMNAAGDTPDLNQANGLKLAEWLLGVDMYLEAARIFRQAAEKDLRNQEAPGAIFKAACLLVGPAHRLEPGIDMLLYLAGNYPEHEQTSLAEQIIERHQEGDQAGVLRCLQEAGMLPAAMLPAHKQAAAVTPDGEPVEELVSNEERERQLKIGRRITQVIQIPLLVTLALFVFTLFARDRYQSVDQIHPAVAISPRQEPVEKPKLVRFTRNDHHFQLHPKYDYEISGLIVSKNDYTMLGLSRGSLLYLMDLCLIWGGNAKSKVYQNPDLEITQAGNVCYTRWKGNVRFNNRELSNNHVIVTSDDLEDIFDDLGEGDQIRMRGQLVDVAVQPVRFDNREGVRGKFSTSTRREDDGMGACEIMHVTRLEVLEPATPLWRLLNRISFWLLLALGVTFICRLVILPLGLRSEKNS